jgi:hypothetical protein
MDRELLIDQVDHQQRIFNQPFKIILVDRYCLNLHVVVLQSIDD